MVYRNKRKKAFIGAIIGAVGSIAATAINAHQQKKAAEAQHQEDLRNARIKEAYNEAAALRQAYANQDYVDNFKQKITMKGGGKINNDRITRAKKFKCGGRKKAELGLAVIDSSKLQGQAVVQNPNTSLATPQIASSQVTPETTTGGNPGMAIEGIANGVTSVVNALISKPQVKKTVMSNPFVVSGRNKEYEVPHYTDRIKQLKCGGRKRKK